MFGDEFNSWVDFIYNCDEVVEVFVSVFSCNKKFSNVSKVSVRPVHEVAYTVLF